jgi:hypothetical protein
MHLDNAPSSFLLFFTLNPMDFTPDDIKEAEKPRLQDGDMSQMMEHELTKPKAFFLNCALSVTAALVAGAVIDNVVRKMQGECNVKREDALMYLALQIGINIVVLFAVSRWQFSFVPWMQLSCSGLFFSVLFFAVQDNLLQNALRATRF